MQARTSGMTLEPGEWVFYGLENVVRRRQRDASKSWTYHDEDSLEEARGSLGALASAYTQAMSQTSDATWGKLNSERLGVMRTLQRLQVHDHDEIAAIIKEYPERVKEIRRTASERNKSSDESS
ncbi:hypothetical protein [Streptomyces sp. NRRL F-525]|uniref:hypothetical protein n=1 Tax=Streptomyces sp. NRRL F-525 TaxID=1463861 RepID=UPI00131B0F17|nr:hypothetical protein [Streptomyces sp. NRRL F-525]